MEKRKQISINKDRQEWFKGLDLNGQVEVVNKALEKVQDTNKITNELGFSWTWVTQILADKGAYYVASLKKIIIANPFTTEEIRFIQMLYIEKNSVMIKEDTHEDQKELTIVEAVDKRIGSAKEESQNRSFYVSNSVFIKFKAYCQAQKSVSNKQLMELAIIELMEKYPVEIVEEATVVAKKETKKRTIEDEDIFME
ncbi:hypothetical protein [Candidatus Clostridium helianthi]|jgi:hypothetical protein|uniref:Uncharacterized protein n=1 Tax=Candidatus Clostridium helianthi TaxID=3381660 RepID=A0ABW8RZC2_9CLOT